VAEQREEVREVQIVKPASYVEKQGGDIIAESVERLDMMLKNENGAGCASRQEGATQEVVDAEAGWCLGR